MSGDKKRAAPEGSAPDAKRSKTKQWRVPKADGTLRIDKSVRPGDRGIWVTCHKGKERKSIGELYDLFEDYATRHIKIPGDLPHGEAQEGDEGRGADDIEQDIANEVNGIKKPPKVRLFEAVWTDVSCVLFFRVAPFIDPAKVITDILEEASKDPARKRTRFTQRLTPAPCVGYSSEEGLEKVAKEVFAPHFHNEPVAAKKFAIRPTIRNHSVLKRDDVIKAVAALVGSPHTVDLNDPDAIILIDVLKNVCSICVVGKEYERLKRFNLQEIVHPTAVSGA